MKFRVSVNGQAKDFDLQCLANSADAREVEPGVYVITAGSGRVIEARVVAGLEGVQNVVIGGARFEVTIEDPRSLSRGGGAADNAGRRKINALMPGKVVRVLVAEGDIVDEGQGLVVVEAMKMQNEMKSPKAGRVAQVMTAPGATVTAGESLLIVE